MFKPITIGTSYAEYVEIVDNYDLTSFRDPNHAKDVFICIAGEDCIKVSLSHTPPAGWEGDDLTAFAIAHLADLNVMEPLMGSLYDLFVKDMGRVAPIKIVI